MKRPSSASPLLILAWTALLPGIAAACPICNTETGRQVRAGIFADDFWTTLLTVASPFPVLLLAIAAYHFDWLKLGRQSVNQPTPDRTQTEPTAP